MKKKYNNNNKHIETESGAAWPTMDEKGQST